MQPSTKVCRSLSCAAKRKRDECHRGKLIASTLVEQGIEVMHIDENGDLKGHGEFAVEMNAGQLAHF